MKNFRTPRTLSECDFTLGYPTMPRPESKTIRIFDVLLAVAIGVALAVLIARAI